MTRRTLAIATLVAMMSASVPAAEPARSPEAERLAERPLELRALFERAPGVTVDDETGMITSGPIVVDVIVARVDTDGKLVKACVSSEEAARRFLEAPIEKVDGRRAKEQ